MNKPIKTGVAIPEQLKCKTCGDIDCIIKDGEFHVSRTKDKPEQPNKNAMIFDQIDGCCDIIEKLLGELVPKTSQVEGCITTHKSWRLNNLKHLRGAFE